VAQISVTLQKMGGARVSQAVRREAFLDAASFMSLAPNIGLSAAHG
jgi:hypothetical protein